MTENRIHALPRSSEPVLPPGPPDFSDVGGRRTHHPAAESVPGAGPNPTAEDPDTPLDNEDARTPGAASVPGAGPNPTAG